MTTRNVLRWSGMAGLSSAIMVLTFTVAFYAGLNDPVFVNTRQIITLLLAQLGAVGLYAAQFERAGRIGLIGFALAFAGLALNVGSTFV